MADIKRKYKTEYERYQNSTDSNELQELRDIVQDTYDRFQNYKLYRNIMLGSAVLLWLYNIYDAHKLGKEGEHTRNFGFSFINDSHTYVWADNSSCLLGLKIEL